MACNLAKSSEGNESQNCDWCSKCDSDKLKIKLKALDNTFPANPKYPEQRLFKTTQYIFQAVRTKASVHFPSIVYLFHQAAAIHQADRKQVAPSELDLWFVFETLLQFKNIHFPMLSS